LIHVFLLIFNGVEAPCVPAGEVIACDTFGSRIDIFVDGSIESDLLRSRIVEAMSIFSTPVTDQMGVQSMQVNGIEPLNNGNNSEISEGEDNEDEPSSVGTNALIGAVATGLGFFLLTLICVVTLQRQQRSTALAHARLEDEQDDCRSFRPRLISSDSEVYKDDDDGASLHYETTVIPIKNYRDERSLCIQSNTSFGNGSPLQNKLNTVTFYETEDFFGTNHPRDRVHQCSAATCEVCERRRQQGILHGDSGPCRARMPHRPERVLSSPERWCVTGDTVQL
jgi:hypothetical protein